MKKNFLFIWLILLIFSLSAFAGEGSDTLGACKLMPELRYSYYEIPMVTDDVDYPDFNGDPVYFDWRANEHSAVVNLTWGAFDNLDLYTFVGARICSTIEGRKDDVPQFIGPQDIRVVFDLGTSFTCGLGVKATFYRSPGGFYVGGGASVAYAVTNGKKHFRVYRDDILIHDSVDDNDTYYQEQNLAAVADLHAGWSFKNIGLTPYVGVEYRWNKAYIRSSHIIAPGHGEIIFREEKPVGVYVGLDYLINNRLNLNLEGHMINRWGGSLSAGYLFDICGRPEPFVPAPAPAPPIDPKLEPMSSK